MNSACGIKEVDANLKVFITLGEFNMHDLRGLRIKAYYIYKIDDRVGWLNLHADAGGFQ